MTIVIIALLVSATTFLKIDRCAATAGSHFSAADYKAYGQASKTDGEYDDSGEDDDE